MSNVKTTLTIADKIKRARKHAGLSQKQLGDAIKLSDKAVSAYEVGRAVPPIETLRDISKVTYTPVSYFMNDTDPEEEELATKIATIERELAEIKELLKKKKNQ